MTNMFIKSVLASFLGLALVTSVYANPFLADRHANRGVTCTSCHKGGVGDVPSAKNVSAQSCLTCHNQAALVKKTSKLDPNPHYNHLVKLSCLECHKAHEPSVNVCNTCHNIQFKVP